MPRLPFRQIWYIHTYNKFYLYHVYLGVGSKRVGKWDAALKRHGTNGLYPFSDCYMYSYLIFYTTDSTKPSFMYTVNGSQKEI